MIFMLRVPYIKRTYLQEFLNQILLYFTFLITAGRLILLPLSLFSNYIHYNLTEVPHIC